MPDLRITMYRSYIIKSYQCLAEEDNGTLTIKTTHEKSGAVTTRKFCPTDEGFTVVRVHYYGLQNLSMDVLGVAC